MQEKLLQLKDKILTELTKVKDIHALSDLEVKYFGRKGELTQILRGIANLSDEDKRVIGRLANEIKEELREKIREVKDIILEKGDENKDIDVTLPGEKIKIGHLHPLTQIQNELEDLFHSLGFIVMDGPELESDYYCFEALNISPYHPARDMQDTFYIDPASLKIENRKFDLVMRTHTSSVQVRAMEKYGAPLRVVVPGRVFRSEATDACHDTMFYQLEGLMIDKNISIANLIAVLGEIFSAIFNKDVKVRVRPGYFPFVEPGLEVDMSCTICGGEGCPSCKHGGWLEMAGAGMVHPNVLRAGGIDPDKYSGFAFGIGLNRLVMMRYGIDDIRLFTSGDLRFLEQF